VERNGTSCTPPSSLKAPSRLCSLTKLNNKTEKLKQRQQKVSKETVISCSELSFSPPGIKRIQFGVQGGNTNSTAKPKISLFQIFPVIFELIIFPLLSNQSSDYGKNSCQSVHSKYKRDGWFTPNTVVQSEWALRLLYVKCTNL
jgi:hypothetical protein